MDQTGETLFSEGVLVNGHATTAAITSAGYIIWSDHGEGPRRRLKVYEEMLGVSSDGDRVVIEAVMERKERFCGRSSVLLVREQFVFEMSSEESARVWCLKLQEFIDSLGRPKRLFVFVNPFGGGHNASKIFTDDVKPLLEDANIEYTLQETKHQLHAKEIVLSLDLAKYDGIVCVSGDGILVEVLNGLLEREDWADAIKMTLGVVPAGTGNGMAKSLLDEVGLPCTAFYATLAIIRGNKRSLDVTTVLQGETKFYSVLMLAWGLVADIDIESEQYRWMGKLRLDVYALQRLFFLRKYNGSIYFIPAPGFEDFGKPTDYKDESMCKDKKDQNCGYVGPDIDLESSNWRKIDGPFVSVWLHNVPWGSEATKAAPDAKFSDGYLDLILMKDCPRLGLFSLMTEMGNGNHVTSPHVSYLKVKAFVLEPGSRTDDLTKGGIVDVDGEVIARGNGAYKAELKSLMNYDKLLLTVHQGLATIFAPN